LDRKTFCKTTYLFPFSFFFCYLIIIITTTTTPTTKMMNNNTSSKFFNTRLLFMGVIASVVGALMGAQLGQIGLYPVKETANGAMTQLLQMELDMEKKLQDLESKLRDLTNTLVKTQQKVNQGMSLQVPLIQSHTKDWALEVHAHQAKISSQGGQDGALSWIFENIGESNRFYVEFGFNQLYFETVKGVSSGANTYELYKRGWRGLLLDGDMVNETINLQKCWIMSSTIVEELIKRAVPAGVDYVSVDIDSADCFVAREIMIKLFPRVITIEFNANFGYEAKLANIGGDYRWRGDRLHGCSLAVIRDIALETGYAMVDWVGPLDIVLVRNDLLSGSKVVPYEFFHSAVRSFHNKRDFAKDLAPKVLCDWDIWKKTRDYTKCTGQPVVDLIEKYKLDLY
jgi:hypothetical protein